MKVVGVSGSLTAGSRTLQAVEAALEGARSAGAEVATELLDLRALSVEFCDGRPIEQYNQETQHAVRSLEEADALLIATPLYRATYTGALKNLFDLVRNEPMAGKAAGLIATGGSDHHFLAIELGLRPLCGFFRMHTVPGGVYAQNAHFTDGQLTDPVVREALQDLGRQVVALRQRTQGLALLAYPQIQRRPGQGKRR